MANSLIEAGASQADALPLDVTSQDSVDRFVTETLNLCDGNIDILLNNAGLVIGLDELSTGNSDEWQTVLDTNVMGVLRVTRGFLPQMLEENKGHIVMVGSIAGHEPYEKGAAYCASKHALKALTKSLRLEVNGTMLRVSSVDPGMVETEFSQVRFRGNKEKADKVYEGLTPLSAQDVADCITFMTSRPPHVNIDQILLMPTAQASAYKSHRKT
jgi:NADP-dependent 3-hydroxy acid dehydrogenase YdfG